MIFSFLATRAGKFAAAGVAVILAVIAFLWWLDSREKAAVERDRAEAAAEIAESQERAQRASSERVEAIRNDTERTNDEARDAARNSDDPLGDAFGKLRERQTRRSAPAR